MSASAHMAWEAGMYIRKLVIIACGVTTRECFITSLLQKRRPRASI